MLNRSRLAISTGITSTAGARALCQALNVRLPPPAWWKQNILMVVAFFSWLMKLTITDAT